MIAIMRWRSPPDKLCRTVIVAAPSIGADGFSSGAAIADAQNAVRLILPAMPAMGNIDLSRPILIPAKAQRISLRRC